MLNLVSGFGTIKLKRLLRYFGSGRGILKAGCGQLISASGLEESVAEKISSLGPDDLEKELALARDSGVRLVTIYDAGYPENLKTIADPPPVLYVKGDLKEEDKISLAVVGSRYPSFYGLSSAEKFSGALVSLGVTVVSGMARGIDTCAHRAALKNGGRTIAVMGSGFNRIYPEENGSLAEDISKQGCVISEFPMECGPVAYNFPQRNRIISGLSLGVLVVEAADNSGALITADFALEQGREVFAVPGKIDSRLSAGTNKLIREGARLALGIEDILDELNLKPISIPVAMAKTSACPDGLGLDEARIYNLLSSPLSFDEVVQRTACDIPGISEAVLALRIKRLIRELPGKQLARN